MAKLKSQGCGLYLLDTSTSPNAYNEIAQIVSIAGPDGSATEIDTTTIDDAAKTFQVGLADNGNVTLETIYDPNNARHTDLTTSRTNATTLTYQLRFSDSPRSTITFNALVPGFSLSLGVDDVVKATFTLRVSGALTFA